MGKTRMSLIQTFFNFDVMMDSLPALVRGLGNTLILSLFSIVLGALLGLFVCLIRLYAPNVLRWVAVVYIDLFRAMPMLVILILIYYALPFLGIRFSSWTSAILAFSLVMGAYSAEVFRAGIEGVPRGQFEAAAALGLPFLITLRRVVLPQAIRAIIPPMTGNCVSMFKDTSLASTVALPELLNEANNSQAHFANPSPLIMAAVIYVIFLWPMVRLVNILEEALAKRKTR
jgi:polar amino acid transport system permease protein